MLNLTAVMTAKKRQSLKTTVLYRRGGKWWPEEVGRLMNGLITEACQHPKQPEYLVLYGHHTKEATLRALDGGMAYSVTLVTGADSDQLPFPTTFV